MNPPQSQDIQDIEPPYFFMTPPWVWWSLVAAACFVLAGLALWYALYHIRKNRLNHIYKLALAKLEHAKTLLNMEDPEPYATFISNTIRGYIAARFGFPITLYTTEEFLGMMKAGLRNPLTPHHLLLQDFLQICDQLKFAQYKPVPSELEGLYNSAYRFVTATRPAKNEQLPRMFGNAPFDPVRVQ